MRTEAIADMIGMPIVIPPAGFRHPEVGEVTLDFEVLHLPDGSGQRILTYTAAPGSRADTSLRLLATHTATLARDADQSGRDGDGVQARS